MSFEIEAIKALEDSNKTAKARAEAYYEMITILQEKKDDLRFKQIKLKEALESEKKKDGLFGGIMKTASFFQSAFSGSLGVFTVTSAIATIPFSAKATIHLIAGGVLIVGSAATMAITGLQESGILKKITDQIKNEKVRKTVNTVINVASKIIGFGTNLVNLLPGVSNLSKKFGSIAENIKNVFQKAIFAMKTGVGIAKHSTEHKIHKHQKDITLLEIDVIDMNFISDINNNHMEKNLQHKMTIFKAVNTIVSLNDSKNKKRGGKMFDLHSTMLTAAKAASERILESKHQNEEMMLKETEEMKRGSEDKSKDYGWQSMVNLVSAGAMVAAGAVGIAGGNEGFYKILKKVGEIGPNVINLGSQVGTTKFQKDITKDELVYNLAQTRYQHVQKKEREDSELLRKIEETTRQLISV